MEPEDAAEEPVVLAVELHPVAGVVELAVQTGGVLQPQRLGPLALQGEVADDPGRPGCPAASTPVCRGLRGSTYGSCSLVTARATVLSSGSAVTSASSSATTTRRMSSSSTTPTTLSPSTTRHGPWWSSTDPGGVADDLVALEQRTVHGHLGGLAVVGVQVAHHPLQRQHVRLGHVAGEVLDVVVGRARRPPRRACRSGRSRRRA